MQILFEWTVFEWSPEAEGVAERLSEGAGKTEREERGRSCRGSRSHGARFEFGLTGVRMRGLWRVKERLR